MITPSYASGPMATRQIRIFNNENVQSLVGVQIYIGYGASDAEMLGKNRYGLVCAAQRSKNSLYLKQGRMT